MTTSYRTPSISSPAEIDLPVEFLSTPRNNFHAVIEGRAGHYVAVIPQECSSVAERHVDPIKGALLFNRKLIGEAFNQYRTIDTK